MKYDDIPSDTALNWKVLDQLARQDCYHLSSFDNQWYNQSDKARWGRDEADKRIGVKL